MNNFGPIPTFPYILLNVWATAGTIHMKNSGKLLDRLSKQQQVVRVSIWAEKQFHGSAYIVDAKL